MKKLEITISCEVEENVAHQIVEHGFGITKKGRNYLLNLGHRTLQHDAAVVKIRDVNQLTAITK